MSDESSGLKEDRKNLLKRAFAMAQGTLTSRILGLFRDIAMGALFDRAVTDAWVAAFRLPNFFRRLLGEGLLQGALLPLYIQTQKEDPSGQKAQTLLNQIGTSLFAFIAVLCLAAVVWMKSLLSLLLATETMSDYHWELTVLSGQIMFFFVFFVSVAALYGAVLQSRGRFGWVGFAPALLNISMLVFTFLPQSWFHFPGESLAWGVFLGGFLQAALLWGVARAQGLKVQWTGWGISESVGKFYRTLFLAMTGVGVFQFSALIHLYFASRLGEGAISALYWADRLMELPLALVSVTLGASLLPTLSKWHLTDKKTFWLLSQETLLLCLFWALPAGLGLYLYAEPIINILFVRGEFQQEDLLRTVTVLKIQALSLIAMSVNRILLPIYYSRQKNGLPLWMSLAGLILQVVISMFAAIDPNHQVSGLRALMVAGLCAHSLTSLTLLAGLGASFPWKDSFRHLSKIVVSCFLLIGVYQLYRLVELGSQGSRLSEGLTLAIALILSIAGYLYVGVMLKSPEALKARAVLTPYRKRWGF